MTDLDYSTLPLANGLETPGSGPKGSPFDHVHPRAAMWYPADNGLLAAPCDPALINTGGTSQRLVAGTVYSSRIWLPKGTATGVWLLAFTAAVTPANCYVGLYNPSRSLVASSADQSSSWTTTGAKQIAFSSAYVNTVPAYFEVAVLVGSAGTSLSFGCLYAGTATSNQNMNLTNYNLRFATSDTSQTSLPSTLGAKTSSAITIWTGVY